MDDATRAAYEAYPDVFGGHSFAVFSANLNRTKTARYNDGKMTRSDEDLKIASVPPSASSSRRKRPNDSGEVDNLMQLLGFLGQHCCDTDSKCQRPANQQSQPRLLLPVPNLEPNTTDLTLNFANFPMIVTAFHNPASHNPRVISFLAIPHGINPHLVNFRLDEEGKTQVPSNSLGQLHSTLHEDSSMT